MPKAAPSKVRFASRVDERPDGGVDACFVVQQRRKSGVLCLSVDSGGEAVTGGSGVLPAEAIAWDAAELFARVDRRPLDPWECRALGLYRDGPQAIPEAFLRFAEGRAVPDPGPIETARAHPGEALLERRYAVPPPRPPCLAVLDASRPLPTGSAKASKTLPGRQIFPERLPGYVKEWVEQVSRHVQGPAGIWFLSPAAWTEAISSWIMAPGQAGERRRQAARLQSGFAPVLAHEPAVSRAIDAGEAFEPVLLEALRDWLPAGRRELLDLPRLKRLRGVDFAGIGPTVTLLGVVARTPLHALPPAGEAPRDLPMTVAATMDLIDRMGLGLDPLMASPLPGWMAARESGREPSFGYRRLRATIGDAFDMASSLAKDLVQPLLANARWGREEPSRKECEWLAGRLLFAGLRLSPLMEASRAWHDDLERLRESAETGRPDLSWPALFEPFDCGEGVTIACLTDGSMLENEGRRGPDPITGMNGMGHCVGTYAEDCHAGDCHVASLRTGTCRLSTVRFELSAPGAGARYLIVAEHRGPRNADPEPFAVVALERLLDAYRRGDVPVNPDALATREDPDAGPVSAEAGLRRVHAAWRQHLPGDTQDVDALLERLRGMLLAAAPGMPAAGG
jgi:hypothetical protein